jgi:hypothetical protein
LQFEWGKTCDRRIAQAPYLPSLIALDLSGTPVVGNYGTQAPPVIILIFSMLAADSRVGQTAARVICERPHVAIEVRVADDTTDVIANRAHLLPVASDIGYWRTAGVTLHRDRISAVIALFDKRAALIVFVKS